MRVSDALWHHASAWPRQAALVVGEQTWTYGELQAAIAGVGETLFRLGLRRGDRMAICLPNCAEYLIYFLAAARYGWVAITVPDDMGDRELTTLMGNLRPKVMAARADWVNTHRALLSEALPGVRYISTEGVTPSSLPDEPALADGGDPFYIGLTSGSTGVPKGVVRIHKAWVQTFAAATAAFGLGPGERFLVPGPLHFSASLFAALHVLEIGGTLFLEGKFDPRRILALIAREQLTAAFMVPTLYQALLAQRGAAPLVTVRCLISCGEKLQPHLRAAMAGQFPAARIYEYYGSSEVGFMTLLEPEPTHDPACVGQPFPGVELTIRRPDGSDAAPGEVGILHAKSPLAAVGYARESTIIPINATDGWIRTGDLARIAPDGQCFLAGRADGATNSGGATVFPAEIEAILATHPAVSEVAVFGRPHPRRGEEIIAAIVLRPGSMVSKRELRTLCAASLASFKRPRAFMFLPELPRTASGKVSLIDLQRS